MANIGKVCVTIQYVTRYKVYPPAAGLHFTDFAIILQGDLKKGWNFYFYSHSPEKDHSLHSYSSHLSVALEDFEVSCFAFYLPKNFVTKVYNIFKNHRKVSYDKKFGILEKCIPRDILPKFPLKSK